MTNFQALILLTSFGALGVALAIIVVTEAVFKTLDLIDYVRGLR
jgi:hypothetical protein